MPPASVYIGGLPGSIGRQELWGHLSIYGKVNALNIQKGFTFVEFNSETDAMDLVATFADQPFMGHNVKTQIAKKPRRYNAASDHTTSPSPEIERRRPRLAPEHARIRYPVVVNNINTNTCWQELKDFGRLAGGTVAFCDIDKSNRRRGFLEYFTQEDADRAVEQLDGKELLGTVVSLSSYGQKTLRADKHRDSMSPNPVHSRPRSRSPVASYRRNRRNPYSNREYPISERNSRQTDNGYASRRRVDPVGEGPTEDSFTWSNSASPVSALPREAAYPPHDSRNEIAIPWLSLFPVPFFATS